jgi:hypothetical protein
MPESSAGVLGRAEPNSTLRRFGLGDNTLAGLVVDSAAFNLVCQAIDRMEQQQLRFIDTAILMWERYEDLKEFIAL